MRKHLAVLALWARLKLGKVFGLLVLMAVFEAALFGGRLLRAGEDPPLLEDLLWGISILCAVTFLAVFALLCWEPGERRYTLGRLSVSEEAVVLWSAACNSVCLLALWAVQTAAALALCAWYAASLPPEYASGQTLFLAFYRLEFLHGLLPLADWGVYLRNLFLALALGFGAAVQPYRYRRSGKLPLLPAALAAATVVLFPQETANFQDNLTLLLLALLLLVRYGGYLIQGRRGMPDEAA